MFKREKEKEDYERQRKCMNCGSPMAPGGTGIMASRFCNERCRSKYFEKGYF